MTKRRMQQLSEHFRTSWSNNTLPFWLEHATDRQYGGFTTFLDRKGAILCSGQAHVGQGRIGWTLARLYNDLEKRAEWLELSEARHRVHPQVRLRPGRPGVLLRDPRRPPLRKRRYLFAEIFAIMAFAEYGKAAGDREALETAKRLMRLVEELYAKPVGVPGALEPKVFPRPVPCAGHSMAMIQINTLQVLRRADFSPDPLPYDRMIDTQIKEVFDAVRQAGEEGPAGNGRARRASTWARPGGPLREPRARHRDGVVHPGRGQAPERQGDDRAGPAHPRLVAGGGVGPEVRRESCTSWTSRGNSRSSTNGT